MWDESSREPYDPSACHGAPNLKAFRAIGATAVDARFSGSSAHRETMVEIRDALSRFGKVRLWFIIEVSLLFFITDVPPVFSAIWS